MNPEDMDSSTLQALYYKGAGKHARKRKFRCVEQGPGGAIAGRLGVFLPTAGHFQVVRTLLPESLERPALGPTGCPERLLSSLSAPSPWASSSSYLQQITGESHGVLFRGGDTEWPLGCCRTNIFLERANEAQILH